MPIRLCGADISQFAIVIHSSGAKKGAPVVPSWTEKAAKVFKKYIYRISGVELSISYDSYPLKREHEILIGGTIRLCDETAGENFSDDEYAILTRDGNLIINGGKRGILYGVYTFLEKYCGVRYLTDTVEKLADAEAVEIGEICERSRPVFEYRELCDWNAWDPDFSVKMIARRGRIRRGVCGRNGRSCSHVPRTCPARKILSDTPRILCT